MSFSGLTNQVRSSGQRSSRQGSGIDMFLLHHQASTNDDGTIAMMVSGSKEVSANYTVSNEGRITGVVDEEDRAWTSGSSSDGGKGAGYDRRAITLEIENESGAPGWAISPAAHESVARLLADLHQRRGIPLTRDNVLGHRELYTRYGASYPTACPGVLNMDWVVNRAREILGKGPAPAPIPGNESTTAGISTNYGYGLSSAAQLGTQQALARLGRYSGVQDGAFGKLSVQAFQKYLKDLGLLSASYTVDGVPGAIYGTAVQKLAAKHGYTGPQDGAPGAATSTGISAWAASVGGAPVQPDQAGGRDWSYWEPTGELGKRVQRALAGMGRYSGAVDGVFGVNTRKGIQTTLNVSGIFPGVVDGVIERGGSYGIQKYAAKFGDYSGPIDGAPRDASWLGFAIGLERK